MRKLFNLLCKIFGHKWNYAIISDCPQRHIRFCTCCKQSQIYKTHDMKNWIWSWMVRYTKTGAKNWAEENKINLG